MMPMGVVLRVGAPRRHGVQMSRTLGVRLGWVVVCVCGGLGYFVSPARAEEPAATVALAAADDIARPAIASDAGVIEGRVQDPDGAWIVGARVRLEIGQARVSRTAETDAEGRFVFAGVTAGVYRLTVTDPGLAVWATEGEVRAGAPVDLEEIALGKAVASAEVVVTAELADIAQAQVQLAEKQRVLGVIPNFYAAYVWDAEPLRARQKFQMAWKMSVDPVSIATSGSLAGIEQAQNSFAGYGRGARGYSRRFGAAYADYVSSTMLGQAVFPALLRQDPRYFVKGKGSVMSRGLYAISSSVMCRGDNRRWQPNYSNVLGNVTAAAISNAYYPATDRHGAGLLIRNSMLSTGAGAIGGLFQEFVVRHFTPHVPDYEAK